jgi:hypothetical protein
LLNFRIAGLLTLGVALLVSCERSSTPERPRNLSPTGQKQPPAGSAGSRLADGDLVFQESMSRQSEMVRALTGSRWTHMGVVFNEGVSPMVLEAVSPVRKTALHTWIARGRDERYVVKRLRDADARLSSGAVSKMRALASTWVGRPYDLRFRWDDETLYCSELAYKLFDRGAGVRLGTLQRAADMNLDDRRVEQALQKRFAGAKFDPNETVVTPDSIFKDNQLVEVEL